MLQQDDPPYLTVGTEVSAKYKGAFCEAKIRKVVRVVKCRVVFKSGHGTALLSDDLVKGSLRMGATVEAKHPDKNQFLEATISKIQDCSQYTVVFDDGDITTLRRSALCLKSGRHFNESETLDQLPLTHPEHFSNPVVGGSGRRGVRRRAPNADDNDSSGDESTPSQKGKKKGEVEVDFGKVVCVELSDKKKGRDPWFPALVVSPAAQETVKIRVKEECLVRSFKDGRYYTVPKKEITEFLKDAPGRMDSGSSVLKAAVEKAVLYLDKDELPPHWDRDALFGAAGRGDEDFGDSDSETSDEVLREKKDNFVAQLYKFMEERGSPINKAPTVCNKDLDLHKLYSVVVDNGGYSKVTNGGQWKNITGRLGFGSMPSTSTINLVKQAYKKYLLHFEEIDKKLGYNVHTSSTSNKPRNSRSVYRSGGVVPPAPKASKKDKDKEDKVAEEVVDKKLPISEPEHDSTSMDSDVASKQSDISVADEPRRSRSRQDSSRSRKDKEKEDEEKSNEKETKKRGGKSAKDKEKEKEAASKKEDDLLKAEPPSPATSSQSLSSSKKGRGSHRKKKEVKVEEEAPVLVEEKVDEQIPGAIGKDVKVEIGDKLSVFYPKGDRNVVYDAKVVDINDKNGKYFVHYLGWNNRYDEWIFRGRIAENLSLRENYQSKSQGKGPAAAQPNQSPPTEDVPTTKEKEKNDEGKDKKGTKKRGRSVTPAPSSATPVTVTTAATTTAATTPTATATASSAGTRSKTASNLSAAAAGTIKRKRDSVDLEEQPVKKKRSYKKSEKVAAISAETISDTDSETSFEAKVSSATPTKQSKSKEKKQQQEEKDKQQKEDESQKKETSEKDKEKGQVLDLIAIRSEMKGVDKLYKTKPGKTSLSPPNLVGVGDQKLDIYEFEEDLSEAPKLKMFSPRSPEKKDEKEKDKKEKDVKVEPVLPPVATPPVATAEKPTPAKPKDTGGSSRPAATVAAVVVTPSVVSTSAPRPHAHPSTATSTKQPIAIATMPIPHQPVLTSHPPPLQSSLAKSPPRAAGTEMVRARMPTATLVMATPPPPRLTAPQLESAINVPVIMKTPSSAMPLQTGGTPTHHRPVGIPVLIPKPQGPFPIRQPTSAALGAPLPLPLAPVVFTPVSAAAGGSFGAGSMFPKDHLHPLPLRVPEVFPHFGLQHKTQEPAVGLGHIASSTPDDKKKRRSPTKQRPPSDKQKDKRSPSKKEKSSGEPKTQEKKKRGGDSPARSGKAAATIVTPTAVAPSAAQTKPSKVIDPGSGTTKHRTLFPISTAAPATGSSLTLVSVSSPTVTLPVVTPSLLATVATPSSAAISKINETISTLMQKTTAATPPEKEKVKAHGHSHSHSQPSHQFGPITSTSKPTSLKKETGPVSSTTTLTPHYIPTDKYAQYPSLSTPSMDKIPKDTVTTPPTNFTPLLKETEQKKPHATVIKDMKQPQVQLQMLQFEGERTTSSTTGQPTTFTPTPATATTPKPMNIAAIVPSAKAGVISQFSSESSSTAGPPKLQTTYPPRSQFTSSAQHSIISTAPTTSSASTKISSQPPKKSEGEKETFEKEKLEKREKVERAEAHRPITPSFLQSLEVLESDEEEVVRIKEKKISKSKKDRGKDNHHTSSSKGSFQDEIKEDESCSSLLCGEEIPGSPAPNELRGLDFGGLIKSKEQKDEEDDYEDDDSPPKKHGGNLERSQSLVVMHDTSPPSTPDSASFSIDTGSPHVDSSGRISPQGGDSSKSKDSSDNDESGDNSKSYYSERSSSRKSSRVELPQSPLSKMSARSRATLPLSSPLKKRRMIRKKSPTDDYAKQFGYRGIRSSSGRRIQSSIDVHEAIRGPPPPPVNLSKRPNSEKFNYLYPNFENVTDPEERINLAVKCMQDIREKYMEVKNRIQTRERKERRRKRKLREKAAAERQARLEAAKALASQSQTPVV